MNMHTDIATSLNAATMIELQGVVRQFHGSRILDTIDLHVPAGQFVALLGASGSGKTSLLRLLAGLDQPDGGHVRVPQHRTTIFQEPRLMPAWPVWRNVVVGLPQSAASKAQALDALAEVGLSHRSDAWPATLSGGEAQRVALARALVRRPDLMLLDEPFAALDALTRARMQKLVRHLSDQHDLTTLIVTHDVDEALLLADRILVLQNGHLHVDLNRHQSPLNDIDLKSYLIEAIGNQS